MRAILPSWELGQNVEDQQHVTEKLFQILGQVLVMCSSPFRETGTLEKKRKKRTHVSSTASASSTIAEETMLLLRQLHPLPAWNKLLNNYIGIQLHNVPQLIDRAVCHGTSEDGLPVEDQVNTIMASVVCVSFFFNSLLLMC